MSDGTERPDNTAGAADTGHKEESTGHGNRDTTAPAQEQASSAKAAAGGGLPPAMDEETQRRLAALRTRVREAFGTVVMAMMMLPRYRHMAISDLQHLVLEPMLNDRIAIAHPRDKKGKPVKDLVGIAIWASVSEGVDRKIREQIRAGVFPIRLKPSEWRSGEINWLLDVMAPDRQATAAVIASFRQITRGRELRLHPIVTRMLDEETLRNFGIRRREERNGAETPPAAETSDKPDAPPETADTEDFPGLDQFDFSSSEKKNPH